MTNATVHMKLSKLPDWIVIVLVTLFVFLVAVTKPGIQNFYKATVPSMVYGAAYKPFVYRALLPAVTKTVVKHTPDKIKQSIRTGTANNRYLYKIFNNRGWNAQYALEYYVILVLMFLSLLGFIFSLQHLLKGVYKVSEKFTFVFSLLVLLGLPPIFSVTPVYIYDFTTLFLFTLSLVLILKRKWNWYLIVFSLAVLNKETAILLTVVFIMHFTNSKELKNNWKQMIVLIQFQLVIFLIVKLALYLKYIGNPGNFVEYWLPVNISLLLTSYSFSSYLMMIFFSIVVFYKWDEKPVFLKASLWILLPLAGGGLCFGWINEWRDYYEVYPIISLLIAHTVREVVKIT